MENFQDHQLHFSDLTSRKQTLYLLCLDLVLSDGDGELVHEVVAACRQTGIQLLHIGSGDKALAVIHLHLPPVLSTRQGGQCGAVHSSQDMTENNHEQKLWTMQRNYYLTPLNSTMPSTSQMLNIVRSNIFYFFVYRFSYEKSWYVKRTDISGFGGSSSKYVSMLVVFR